MEKKTQDFSKEDILRMASSPAGQQLLALLRQGDNAALAMAIAQAKAGNMAQAGQTISTMLSSPEAQKLIKELGGK